MIYLPPSSSSSSSNKPELIKSSNLPDETFDQLLTDIIDEWQLYNNNNKRQNNDFIISSNSYDDVNVSDHNSINVDNDDDDLKPNMKKFHNRFEQLIQMVSSDDDLFFEHLFFRRFCHFF